MIQSGTTNAPYPHTVASIHDNNQSQSSNLIDMTIAHPPILLNSLSSADPTFSHLKQRSDMEPVYQSIDNSLNFYQMQQ
jgi:hypothetical protein